MSSSSTLLHPNLAIPGSKISEDCGSCWAVTIFWEPASKASHFLKFSSETWIQRLSFFEKYLELELGLGVAIWEESSLVGPNLGGCFGVVFWSLGVKLYAIWATHIFPWELLLLGGAVVVNQSKKGYCVEVVCLHLAELNFHRTLPVFGPSMGLGCSKFL